MIKHLKNSNFLLFALILVVKVLLNLYFTYLDGVSTSEYVFYNISGDAHSYFIPMENLINNGIYAYVDLSEPYAGRMPYYGAIYFLLRQFLEQDIVFTLIVILQLIVEVLALFCLAKLSSNIVQKRKELTYYSILFLGAFYAGHTIWSRHIFTESLSLSFLIFSLYFFHKYWSDKTLSNLLKTGSLLALVVSLRPYFVMLYLPIGLLFVWRMIKNDWRFKDLVKNVLWISIPMLVLLSPWIIRNAYTFGKFIPLQDDVQAGYKYSKSYYALWDFIASWGGSIQSWDKRAAGCIFEPRFNQDCSFEYPDYMFTSAYDYEDVEELREDYINLSLQFDSVSDNQIAKRFNDMEDAFRKEKPFRYYFISPMTLISKMVFHSGSYYMGTPNSGLPRIAGLGIKLFQSVIYYLLVIMGSVGILMACRTAFGLYLGFIPVFILVLFAVILKAPEFRFFMHAYPISVLGTVVFVHYLGEKLKLNRFKLFRKIS